MVSHSLQSLLPNAFWCYWFIASNRVARSQFLQWLDPGNRFCRQVCRWPVVQFPPTLLMVGGDVLYSRFDKSGTCSQSDLLRCIFLFFQFYEFWHCRNQSGLSNRETKNCPRSANELKTLTTEYLTNVSNTFMKGLLTPIQFLRGRLKYQVVDNLFKVYRYTYVSLEKMSCCLLKVVRAAV